MRGWALRPEVPVMPEPQVVTSMKVRLLGSEGVVSTFATNVAITATEHEITIAFFEALLPMGPTEMAERTGGEIPARCVAKIAVPASRFTEIAALFKTVLETRATQEAARIAATKE